jgi:hypothetical protein
VKPLRPYGLLLVGIMLAGGCSAGHQVPAPADPPKSINIFIVPDLSESAFGASRAHGEHVVAEALAEAAQSRGHVTVVALTNDTAGQTNIGLEADFAHPPAWVEPTNDQSMAMWVTSYTNGLMDAYRRWLARQHPAAGSDYLGMLLVASRLVAASSPARQEVWVMGDGIQNTGQWSMYRHHPTAAECKTKATAMKQAGDLGQLGGAAVYFIGGGLNSAALFTPAEQAQLTACWGGIVHIAGGRTPVGWWNPARLMAPEAQ